MTDTIEAVALKLRTDLDEAAKQHMPAMVVTTDYLRTVLDSIAAMKAEIERLTELATLMIAEYDPLEHLIGNGCAHGFKPAKACPNEDCRERKLHRALDPEAIAKGEG